MNVIFTIINLILITGLSFFGVKGCYRMAAVFPPPEEAAETVVGLPKPKSDTGGQPLSAYNAIIQRNLFNTKKVTAAAIAQDDWKNKPITELNLKLWGTVTRTATQGAYAVIEDTKEHRQNLYRVGDTVQNAIVKSIQRERVMLTVNGRDEILSMDEKEKPPKPQGQQMAAASSTATDAAGAQRVSLMRSQIDSAMENVTELMGQIKVRPYFENGQPEGLMLSSINPQSIFRKMGLRNGDVITGVDGQKIESVDDALKFYESMRSSPGMKLDIKRQGRPKTIEYSIK